MIDYIKILQDQLDSMAKQTVQSLPTLVIALFVLCVTWGLARFAVTIAGWLTRKTPMRENLKQLVETLVRLAIWIFGLLLAATISMPGLTPASLFAGLGVGTLAIGFAFQDIFENFLAGVLIMIRDKVDVGATIECQNITGRVERFTLRETYIRAPSNELMIVPNSMLFKNPMKVVTDSPQRRFELVVAVTNDSDLDQASATIRKAVESVEQIDKTKPVEVFAQEFKPGEVDFLVRWWSSSRKRDLILKDEIVRRVKHALDTAEIELPGAPTPPAARPRGNCGRLPEPCPTVRRSSGTGRRTSHAGAVRGGASVVAQLSLQPPRFLDLSAAAFRSGAAEPEIRPGHSDGRGPRLPLAAVPPLIAPCPPASGTKCIPTTVALFGVRETMKL